MSRGKTTPMDEELKLYYEKQIKRPFTDNLTGLFNHGFFQIFLDHEIERSKRYAIPFTLGSILIRSLFTTLVMALSREIKSYRELPELSRQTSAKQTLRPDMPVMYSLLSWKQLTRQLALCQQNVLEIRLPNRSVFRSP
jgi:hypothetical protein